MPLTLASDAITFTNGTSLSSGIIGTAQLSAGAVTTTAIASGAVTTEKIAIGAVITDDLANGAVTASKMSGNQTGSAPVYGCRAWVNFDGRRNASGNVALDNTARFIRGSGNVTNVVRNDTGVYTITFATAMPDANYSAALGGQGNTSESTLGYLTIQPTIQNGYSPTLSALQVRGVNGANGTVDLECCMVSIFR